MPGKSSPVTPQFPNALRVVLIHGAAVTSRVWDSVVAELQDLDIVVPQRACSGDLDREVDALAPLCDGALVIGVSGGATLGLELAARGVAFHSALLHEPAVGSLVPGLLAPMIAAHDSGGVPAFGSALYGPCWAPSDAPDDPSAVARDLAMFSRFEPRAPKVDASQVVITVGANSGPRRHEAARVLSDRFGFRVLPLADTAHAVHLEQPHAYAALIRVFATDDSVS